MGEVGSSHTIFRIGDLFFEYDDDKNQKNIEKDDILFVVYTERTKINCDGKDIDVIRLISARYATNFERGIYYGKY